MYIFLEKGIRGRICYISNKYVLKPTKNIQNLFDSKRESKYILYLGADIIYGYSMFKFLQSSGSKWKDHKEFD